VDSLIRYARGHGSPGSRRRLERHLAQCSECRVELNALSQGAVPEVEQLSPPVELLSRILSEARIREGSRPPGEVKARIARQCSPYLGNRAIERLAGSGAAEDRLISAVEPVLALFLGARAAGLLISHALDHTL
jgi:anti-sigma factor RsiW